LTSLFILIFLSLLPFIFVYICQQQKPVKHSLKQKHKENQAYSVNQSQTGKTRSKIISSEILDSSQSKNEMHQKDVSVSSNSETIVEKKGKKRTSWRKRQSQKKQPQQSQTTTLNDENLVYHGDEKEEKVTKESYPLPRGGNPARRARIQTGVPLFNTTTTPSREVVCEDTVKWLESQSSIEGSIVTGIPDVSETGMSMAKYEKWFILLCTLMMQKVVGTGLIVFIQTDIKREGKWIDKSFLCNLAAHRLHIPLLFHKICVREKVTSVSGAIATYSWPRATGLETCRYVMRYIARHTNSKTIIDPFCGQGSILAMANEYGLNAIGIDHSVARCRIARGLALDFEKGKFIRPKEENKLRPSD